MRVLELFCGIGGCTAAIDGRAEIAAAIDVDRDAIAVYRHNYFHPTRQGAIESLRPNDFRTWNADLWWMSPPCQPYTIRGRQRDLDDPRAEGFQAVLRSLREFRPRYVALENVAGFLGSRAHALLGDVLTVCGYGIAERVICPSELGIPNRRPRFYLVAAQEGLLPWSFAPLERRPLAAWLDRHPPAEVFVSPSYIDRYWTGVNLVDANDENAMTCCFTSAYGRSPVFSGSYLKTVAGVRRFLPSEILRLFGFPSHYRLPGHLSLRRAWSLVGNSLSVFAVRVVLSAFPELRSRQHDAKLLGRELPHG